MTKEQAINNIITIAKAEIGYLEKKTNASLDDKTANAGSNNYTKYWRDIKPEYQAQPWCACFVTWCFVQAFGVEKTIQLLRHYPYTYCPTMATLFTLNANPKVGDIVIFKHNGEFTHTGIVTYVEGDFFMTIEGNTSGGSTIISNGGGVCQKSYYNSNLPGTKFCTPDWSIVANGEADKPVDMTALKKAYEEVKEENKQLRADVDLMMRVLESTFVFDYVDDNMPEWAQPAVTAARDCGALKGGEEGRLNLSYKDLRQIVREYRTGMYDKKAVHK